jgi:hypothetical protein
MHVSKGRQSRRAQALGIRQAQSARFLIGGALMHALGGCCPSQENWR